MSESTEKVARVVVGVDGSVGSKAALRWALAEAHLRKAPLRIVHVWSYAHMAAPGEGYGYMGGFVPYAPVDGGQVAMDLLDGVIGEVADEVMDVEIERQVIDGAAAAALVGAVTGGDLLVVGSRGHGGFTGLLLGSVSQQCVQHAPCPVVVVHPLKAEAGDRESTRSAPAERAIPA